MIFFNIYKVFGVKNIFSRKFLYAWLVLVLSLLFTLLGWAITKYIYEEYAHEHFQIEASEITYHTENKISTLEHIVQSCAGYINTHHSPTPDEWKSYIASLQSSSLFDSIESVGFIRIQKSASGNVEYKVTLSHPVHPYSSIKIGQDLWENPILKEALSRSIDRGKTTLSSPFMIKDEKNHKTMGQVLVYPIYSGQIPPATLEQKRNRIIGFVFAPFYIEHFLEKNHHSFHELHIEIHDLNLNNTPLTIFHSPVKEDIHSTHFHAHTKIPFSGRVWDIHIYPMPQFESELQTREPLKMALIGIVLSISLFMGVALLLQNRRDLEEQNQLSESQRQRLEILLSSSSDGIHIIDPIGKLHLFSASFAQMLDYSPGEMDDFKIQDWDSKLTEQEITSYLSKAMTESITFETVYRTKNGGLLNVEIITKPIMLDGVPYIYCSARDITVRIQRLHDLYLFEELLHNSNDMIFIIRMRDISVEFVNDAVTKTLGYTPEEIKAMGIEGFRRPLETAPENSFHAHLSELEQKRKMTDYAILKRKDGSEFLVEANVKAVSYHNEEYNIAIVRDITEREKILEELQQTATILAEAQRLAKLGSWIYEHKTGKNEWSEESHRILELNSSEEPNLESFLSMVHQKDRPKLRHDYNLSVKNHTSFDDTVRVILPSNTQKFIRVSGEHFYDHDGKVLQSRGMFQDVTETVIAQQTIENDRERLRAIADMGSDWYWEHNSAGVLTHISDNISKTLGYESKELIDKQLINFASASMSIESIAALNELFRKHQRINSFIININAKNGESLVFELNAEPVYSVRKKFIGYRGIARDITVQHTLQKQLIEQNNELRTIFETSRDGIVITDFKGNFLDFNKAYMDITGYSRGELMTMGYADITPPDQVESVYQQALKLLEGEPYVNITKTTIDKNKKPHTISMTLTLMPDHQRILAAIKDITEQQTKANELAETYERLKMATEAANIGIWIWNIHDNALIWDEKMFHIYHMPLEKRETGLKYDDWISRVHPDDMLNTEEALQNALSGVAPYNLIFRIRFDEGILKYIQATAVVKYDSAGKPVTMVGINRDVTNDKTIEQALIKAKTAAEEANHAKSNFIANMSHEIRTPLNGLIGLTELTLKTELTAQQYDYLKKADQSAKALMNVINDILDYSKIEAGKFTLDIHPFNLKELLEIVYDLFEYKALEKHIDFEIDIYSDVPVYLKGDSLRITQVLINLVGNALKFTDQGSVRVQISHHSSNDTHEFLFQIIDTGIGISSENLDNLFEPFSQADPSSIRKYGGTGLGLAISKELIHLMNGELTASSILGHGSTFAFNIPLKFADESEIISHIEPKDENLELTSHHILLVEDNEINQVVASEKLKHYGIEVTIAPNGLEAVEMFKNRTFDLIFMDLQMPVMDGFEATRQIRSLQSGSTVPIIALSAAAMKEDRDLALQAGMNDHISKPIITSDLEKILQRYLITAQQDQSFSPAEKEVDDSMKMHSIHFEELKHSLNHNHEIIVKLFLSFSQQYTNHQSVFAERFEHPQDFDLYIHKLKGISGNLHMEKLYALSGEYAQHKSDDTLHAIEHELANVLFIVHSYLKENISENQD